MRRGRRAGGQEEDGWEVPLGEGTRGRHAIGRVCYVMYTWARLISMAAMGTSVSESAVGGRMAVASASSYIL